MSDTIQSDQVFRGSVNMANATSVQHKDGSVLNAHIASGADIVSSKQYHRRQLLTDFGVAADAAPSADVYRTIYHAPTACTITSVSALLRDTGTSTDVKFNLYKTTAGSATLTAVLSATIDLTHGSTDNTASTGTLSVTSLAAGDTLVAFMDYTSATGALGPALRVELEERPS